MKTFVRVAEVGTLSGAGRDLGLSQPAVSQQLSTLEDALGVRLLHRTTRGLRLTEAGERYFLRAKDILEAVAEAEDGLEGSAGELRGVVRIQAPSGFGQMHVVPSLIELKHQHPSLTIDLHLEDRLSDLISEGIDLAIRFGTLRSPGLTVRRLGSLERLLVAAPRYADARGLPMRPEDLIAHPFVRFSWTPGGDELTLLGSDGPITVQTQPTFLANNAFAVIEAVRSGLGVGATQAPLVHNLLARGELIRVLPDFTYPPLEVHAVYPSRRFIPRRVRAVVAHLVATMARVPGLATGR